MAKSRKNAQLFSLAVLAAALSFFPIFYIFLTSLKPLQRSMMPDLWIFNPTFESYSIVLRRGGFSKSLMNSLIVASSSTIISLAVGSLGGYSLARGNYKGKEGIATWILTTRMVPAIAVVIPFFMMFYRAGLIDTQIALIVVYMVFNLPLAVWMMRSYFEEVPKDLDESAMIDGCGIFDAFRRIILPVSIPGLAATAILSFMLSWNEFMMASVLTGANAKTLPLETLGYVQQYRGVLWSQMAAASILTMLPVAVLAVFVQKHLVRGLTLGAVRG